MFRNVDETVRKNTLFIAGVTLICSMLMQAVFLIIGQWDYTVLLGNLLGAALAVGNFFLLGLTVQKVVSLPEDEAKSRIKVSQQLRLLLQVIGCIIAGALPCFHLVAVLIPLLFPRIGATLWGMMDKKDN